MRIIKHGLLSLMRKPTKAGMIFVILFVVFSLVFTGVIIQNSISKSKAFIRQKLGAVVEYKADYMKAYKDNLSDDDYDQLKLSKASAESIQRDQRVDKVYINLEKEFTSKTLKSAISYGNDEGVVFVGGGDNEAFFSVKSTQGGTPLEFDDQKLTITSGRQLNEKDETSGENVLLISEDFATKNELSVGDEIKLSPYGSDKASSFSIVGIYKKHIKEMSSDTMYTSNKAFGQVNDMDIRSIYFKLKDPLDVDSFINDHEKNLPSKYMVLDAGNKEYKKLTKPLDLMSMISSILIWVIFIAGACIIISLITIFVRDRKFEIGLLLSSGEGKHKIVLQFIIEIIIVAILAFIVSVLLSYQTSSLVSTWIVDNQLIEKEEDTNLDFLDYGDMSTTGQVSIDNVAKDFNVSITFDVMKNLFIISIGIVLIASLIPILVITSFNPRQALQD